MPPTLTNERIIEELTSLIRQTDDAIAAAQVVEAYFSEEFEKSLSANTAHARERTAELYQYVISPRGTIDRLKIERRIFEAALDAIKAIKEC